jgi:hypothetical protein
MYSRDKGFIMYVYAGKTRASRYDNRAPVHLALSEEDEDGTISDVRSICSDRSVTPLSVGACQDITCPACQQIAVELLATA